jgi:hypothetical protein
VEDSFARYFFIYFCVDIEQHVMLCDLARHYKDKLHFLCHNLVLIFDVRNNADTAKILEVVHNFSLKQLYFLLTWCVLLCKSVDWSCITIYF